MTVTSSPINLLESVLNSRQTQADINVAVLKKAQDQMKQQGEAIVELLESAGPPPLLDAYA
jgi:hypothetical protein